MAKLVTLFISPDGALEYIYDDDVHDALKDISPKPVTFRASHVEPSEGGGWYVDVSPITGLPTPQIIGTYPTRAAALEAEVEWVTSYLASSSVAHAAL